MANFERKVRRNTVRRELMDECKERNIRPAKEIGKKDNKPVLKTISINSALGDRWRAMAAEKLKAQLEARKLNQLKKSNVKKKKGIRLFKRKGDE